MRAPSCTLRCRQRGAADAGTGGRVELLAGDELGQTQHGNNNAYCQDSALAWIDWELDAERQALLSFVRKVIALRRSEPVFSRRRSRSG